MFGQDDNSQGMGQVGDNQGVGGSGAPAIQSHTSSYDGVNTDATTPPAIPEPVTNVVAPTVHATSAAPASDDLAEIKQQALHQLMPVIDKLEQTPEEKFRTTMMVIQASDNRDLIKPAYEAAMQIADEKERALALVSIVNEINYFSQNDAKPPVEQ